MMGQKSQMETNSARNQATVINGTSDDVTRNAISTIPSSHLIQSDGVLDGEKTGATLLFCGSFLGLVGIMFTAMGWLNYRARHNFVWTQLLGPILLSVGGAFIFIGVCKFGMISCQSCRQWDEEEKLEQIPTGHSFVFNRSSQPITFHGAAVLQYIPPPYASVTQDVNPANGFQPNGAVNGIPLTFSTQYYTVCSIDNLAFPIEEDNSPINAETDHRSSRIQETVEQEDEKGCDEESSSTCSHPPAYEDIYPSLHTDNLTSVT